jgi:DNA-binding IscR family transcriptional regulator
MHPGRKRTVDAICRQLIDFGPSTVSEIATATSIDPKAIQSALADLCRAGGVVCERGTRPGIGVYRFPADG